MLYVGEQVMYLAFQQVKQNNCMQFLVKVHR